MRFLCSVFHLHNWSRPELDGSLGCLEPAVVKYCRRCGEKCVVASDEHVWGEDEYISPGSCEMTRYCKKCKREEESYYKPRRHEWAEWRYPAQNDCSIERVCLRCGKKEVAVQHEWSDWRPGSDVTCSKEKVCSRCGEKETMAHYWGDSAEPESSDDASEDRCPECGCTDGHHDMTCGYVQNLL